MYLKEALLQVQTYYFLFLTILITPSISAQAQFGVKGGLNYTTFKVDIKQNFYPRTAYNFGIYADFELTNTFAIQPEILFSSKGADFNKSVVTNEEKFVFNYLNLPVLAKFQPTAKLGILAGPELGYLLSARAKGDGINNDIKERLGVRNFDLGIAIGVEYEPINRMGVGVRYSYGITPLIEVTSLNNAGVRSTTNDLYNRTFQLYASYRISK